MVANDGNKGQRDGKTKANSDGADGGYCSVSRSDAALHTLAENSGQFYSLHTRPLPWQPQTVSGA